MTIPPELLRSRPRDVSVSSLGYVAAGFALVAPFVVIAILRHDQASEPETKYLWPMVILVVVCFVFVCLQRVHRVRREMALLSNGRAVVATTTGPAKRIWFTDVKRPRFRVPCRFAIRSGALRTATVKSGTHIPADTGIVIVYDPDQPERALLYPVSYLKVRGAE